MLFFCPRPEPTNFLIKNNASVSAVDKVNRNTPLHCAVLAGNVDAAHILLEAGASVDAENINVSFAKLLQTELLIGSFTRCVNCVLKTPHCVFNNSSSGSHTH